MSIIDRWYCPQCGSRNIVGGIVAECWQCSTPRPGISAVAYRTPACDKHLSRNDEHECPWCKLEKLQQEYSEWAASAEIEKLKAERDGYASRLDTAERALERHGYRRSCNIPACNCGDQWNHGGHAAERLREISDEVYTNGKTVLQAVKDVCAERDRYRNALELLRPGIEIDLRYADPDDDIDALRSRAQTIREALSDE